MKKIIAISVMLVLIAGAAFADTTISGAVETRFQPAKQTGGKNAQGELPKPVTAGQIGTAYINLTGSNGDGTLGGTFRLRGQDVQRSGVVTTTPLRGSTLVNDNDGKTITSLVTGVNSGNWVHKAFVWWKPLDQVKLFLGIENDGMFDTCDFVGWGYHSGDNDYLFNHQWDFWRQIFPGNWDGFGFAASFYPIPGLDINLVIPTGSVGWPQARQDKIQQTDNLTNPDADHPNGTIPGRLRLTVNYALDFGKISFVYLGGAVAAEKAGGIAWNYEQIGNFNNGLVGASVLVTAIDSVQIKVGGSIILNNKSKDNLENVISAGGGVAYTGDGFGIKARAGVVMQKDNTSNLGDKPFITFGVLPFLSVGEKGQALFDIAITSHDNGSDNTLGWSFCPAYRLNIEGGAFKIGFQIYQNVTMGGNITLTNRDYTNWNIPMLLFFVF